MQGAVTQSGPQLLSVQSSVAPPLRWIRSTKKYRYRLVPVQAVATEAHSPEAAASRVAALAVEAGEPGKEGLLIIKQIILTLLESSSKR